MSSTSSSERGTQKRSATEILASRYRHLFVLPSAYMLLLFSALVSFVLAIASRGQAGIYSFLPALAVFVLSATAVSSALYILDKKTVASFRRVNAVLLAGGVLWLICAAGGLVYSLVYPSAIAINNAMLFGAFLCAGLEFLVINGTFTERTSVALGLSAIHPASTLVILRGYEISRQLDVFALGSGAVAFGIVASFVFMLRRRKTSLGYSGLTLFQAFMKTWTNGDASELETIISAHSEEAEVTTKVLRFHTHSGDAFIVLPGVHPGPFHPVGSYDLPGVVSKAFEGLGPVLTLHRPGGHERNLATKADTVKYAAEAGEFAKNINASEEASVRGPLHSQVGKANVTSTAFARDMLVTVSFAPLGSDDLNPKVEEELAGPASAAGFNATVVDAHNSIDPRLESPDTADPGWSQLFQRTKTAAPSTLRVGYSHSNELGFKARGDLTENGMGLLMLETGAGKSALVLADANNAVPSLRGEASKTLEPLGYNLIEFCTSDSHNLAARGLTVSRGYKALGEATPVEAISKAVGEMAKLADGRLEACSVGSGQMTSKVRVFGSKALDEFAGITQASSRLGRAYLRFAVGASAVLLVLSLAL